MPRFAEDARAVPQICGERDCWDELSFAASMIDKLCSGRPKNALLSKNGKAYKLDTWPAGDLLSVLAVSKRVRPGANERPSSIRCCFLRDWVLRAAYKVCLCSFHLYSDRIINKMATIVEKTSSGIIYKASQQRDFPQLDLLSLLFGKAPWPRNHRQH